MEKIQLLRDKKLYNYIVTVLVMVQILILLFRVRLYDINNIINVNYVFNVVQFLIAIFTVAICLKLRVTIWLDNEKVKIGHLFPKIIKYKDIQTIEVDNKFNMCLIGNRKTIRIKLVNTVNNRRKYFSILEIIEKKINFKIDKEIILKKVIERKKNIYKERLSGFLKIFNIFILSNLIFVVFYIFNFTKDSFSIDPNIFVLILLILNIVYSTILLYLIFRRHSIVKKIITTYCIYNLILYRFFIFTPNWILVLMNGIDFYILGNIIWMIWMLIDILIILIVSQYFRTSEKAEYTFVFNKSSNSKNSQQ